MALQVVGDGFVLYLGIAHCTHNPGKDPVDSCWHQPGLHSRIVLIVLLIEIVLPTSKLFASTQNLVDVHTTMENLNVFHELFRLVFRVKDAQVSKHAMGIVQPKACSISCISLWPYLHARNDQSSPRGGRCIEMCRPHALAKRNSSALRQLTHFSFRDLLASLAA